MGQNGVTRYGSPPKSNQLFFGPCITRQKILSKSVHNFFYTFCNTHIETTTNTTSSVAEGSYKTALCISGNLCLVRQVSKLLTTNNRQVPHYH